ncbi:MAG: DUF177 domain-containing protein [candidate division WOR-3 bacterium]
MRSPLAIPLGSIRQGETRFSYELEPDELGLSEHEVAENPSFAQLLGRVRVDVGVVRTGQRLMVAGSVSFRAQLICALCGVEYECVLSELLSAEFLDYDPTEEPELSTDEVDRVRLRGDLLDLVPLTHDAVHLAVPMAPTCRPDCRGLCPCCGANLNLTGHDSSCPAGPLQ